MNSARLGARDKGGRADIMDSASARDKGGRADIMDSARARG